MSRLTTFVFSQLLCFVIAFDNDQQHQRHVHEQLSTNRQTPTCFVRQYNFTVSPVDGNGLRCRGEISVNACYGACETFEFGTHAFPARQGSYKRCMHDQTREKIVTLTDCDDGFDENLKTYNVIEAVTCACQSCDPEKAHCQTVKRTDSSAAGHERKRGVFGKYVDKQTSSGRLRAIRSRYVQYWGYK